MVQKQLEDARYMMQEISKIVDQYTELQKERSEVTGDDVQEAIDFIDREVGYWLPKRKQVVLAALRQMQGWIPVSEPPKEAYGCFVVVDEDDHNGNPHSVVLPYAVGFDGTGWNNVDGETIPFEVTHWMSLPEPPKEKA
jgi:hypothetical protein